MGRILRSMCRTHVPFVNSNDHRAARPDNMAGAAAAASERWVVEML